MSFSTPYDIPGHFKRQFSDTWDMVLQQKNQKFASAGLTESGWTAREYIWQDLETVASREVTGQRLGDTNPQELSGSARRGNMRSWDIPVIRDKWDNKWLERQALPDSDVIATMKAAANRALDDAFIDACDATVYGGQDPYNTAIAFPNASKIGVQFVQPNATAINTGLTPWKILEATRLLESAEVDPTQEELYLAITPRQKFDMAYYASTATNDVWGSVIGDWLKQDAKGVPAKLMGYNVIMTNRLRYLDQPNDIRAVYAFARSAFKVSPVSQELTIDRLPEKRNAIQFYSCMHFGALRTYDEKVIQIACDQSPPAAQP